MVSVQRKATQDEIRVTEAALRRTVASIFERVGVCPPDAAEATDVLVMSDLRGVESHGVSNMLRLYVKSYRNGRTNPSPGWKVEKESAATAVIDAERRLGVIVGPKCMRLAIEKARRCGVGVVTVRHGGHFGAIGHHAMIAAGENMVGVCMVGTGGFDLSMLPTFSAEPMFGTNPIAVAAPAGKEAPFLFDAATTIISGNKIRSAVRSGEPLLPGWVADKQGNPITSAIQVQDRYQLYMLPLGGTREQGSHKGYGLSMTAEILASLLSGSMPNLLDNKGGSKAHFAAYDIAAFSDLATFKRNMDQMLGKLKNAKPVDGEARVLYPGLLEAETVHERRKNGIPLHREVIRWFGTVTSELGLPSLEVPS